MNETLDDNHEDDQISALYRKVSAEQPPSHLDDAILAAAKREVHATPRPLSPFSTRWTLPFSLAAVIVLSVSVVTLVQKDSLREISGSAGETNDVAESISPRPEEKIAKLKMEAEAPRAEPEKSVTTTPIIMKTPMEKAKSPKRLAAPPTPVTNPPTGNEAVADSSGLSSQVTRDEAAAGITPQPSVVIAPKDAQNKPSYPQAKPLSKSVVEKQEVIAADSTDSETSVSTATVQSLDQSRQQPSRRVLAFKAAPTAPQEQPLEQSQELPKPVLAQPVISATVESSSAPSCASLSAKDCLQAPQCIYVLRDESDHDYICRDAANRCEQGFNQLQGTKQSCESKSGCRFIPGHCECPEGLPCDCRGINPPQCTHQ